MNKDRKLASQSAVRSRCIYRVEKIMRLLAHKSSLRDTAIDAASAVRWILGERMMTEYMKEIYTPENWIVSQFCHPAVPVEVSIFTLPPSHTTLHLLYPGVLPAVETTCNTTAQQSHWRRVLPIWKFLLLILISLHTLPITSSRFRWLLMFSQQKTPSSQSHHCHQGGLSTMKLSLPTIL